MSYLSTYLYPQIKSNIMNRNDTPINGAAGASIVAIPVNQPTID